METRVQELVKYCATVLIVPCGMETTMLEERIEQQSVLIVPCGMETV